MPTHGAVQEKDAHGGQLSEDNWVGGGRGLDSKVSCARDWAHRSPVWADNQVL